MKKLIILMPVLFVLACSKDDDKRYRSEEWTTTISSECPNANTLEKHCITEEVHDFILESIIVGQVCNWISFQDVDGNSQAGYYRSTGYASPGVYCNN